MAISAPVALGGEEEFRMIFHVQGGEFPQSLQKYTCTPYTEEPRLLCETKVRLGPEGVVARGTVDHGPFSVFRDFDRGQLAVKYVQYEFEARFLFDTSDPQRARLIAADGNGHASALWTIEFPHRYYPPPQRLHGVFNTGPQGILLTHVDGTNNVTLSGDLNMDVTGGEGIFDHYATDCGANRDRICVFAERATFSVTPEQLQGTSAAALAAGMSEAVDRTLRLFLKRGRPTVLPALPADGVLEPTDRRALYYSTKPGARCTTTAAQPGGDPQRVGAATANKRGIARITRGSAVNALAEAAGTAEPVYVVRTKCLTRSGRTLRNRTRVRVERPT